MSLGFQALTTGRVSPGAEDIALCHLVRPSGMKMAAALRACCALLLLPTVSLGIFRVSKAGEHSNSSLETYSFYFLLHKRDIYCPTKALIHSGLVECCLKFFFFFLNSWVFLVLCLNQEAVELELGWLAGWLHHGISIGLMESGVAAGAFPSQTVFLLGLRWGRGWSAGERRLDSSFIRRSDSVPAQDCWTWLLEQLRKPLRDLHYG